MVEAICMGNHNYYCYNYNFNFSVDVTAGGIRRWRLSPFTARAFLKKKKKMKMMMKMTCSSDSSSVVHDSLKLLEWDCLCNSVASFARTSPGKQATLAQLWALGQTYEESKRLLDETNAAVEMHKYGSGIMDFNAINIHSVNSGLENARRGLPVDGSEAMAVVALLRLVENMQYNLKAAIKEDEDWYQRFMPLSEKIMELATNRLLVKFVQQLLDDDGSVRDSASSALKRSREQVRLLEKKLCQLMDGLARNKLNDVSALEVSNIDGRMCLRLLGDSPASFEGLLLSSHSGGGSIVEPLSAVPLNDELQHAKASVAKAEADVMLKITEKMQVDLVNIENLSDSIVQLDVINARATYSLSFGGSCPDLFLPKPKDGHGNNSLEGTENSTASYLAGRKWTLYIPRAYHPLLLQQHRQNLQMAIKEVSNAKAEIRRRKQQGENRSEKEETDIDLSSLEMQVTQLKQAYPIPVDIFIAKKTKVLVVTGPNTGGKTIFLKTVGLAVMMAKSGLYVLSSESVKIPWFDFVFADIGDEQSLSQSLSTFSGHLRQISEILKYSTSQSLVLLDEVGAGTNPLEGAALGMSLLESFAESGPLLAIATTHHGELKTLKYSNKAFENACMEFDDVNLKPTYRILWGVPGRSNAINIAERLGLPNAILDNARELYGTASAEINEVIIDMERLKQSIHKHVSEAQNHIKLSRDLHAKLLTARRKLKYHADDQRYRKMLEITEMASRARSNIHKKVRQLRASATRTSQSTVAVNNSQFKPASTSESTKADINEVSAANNGTHVSQKTQQISPVKKAKLPEVGDIVHVKSLNKEATVLKVEPSKGDIFVQAGIMKMKLNLADVST